MKEAAKLHVPFAVHHFHAVIAGVGAVGGTRPMFDDRGTINRVDVEHQGQRHAAGLRAHKTAHSQHGVFGDIPLSANIGECGRRAGSFHLHEHAYTRSEVGEESDAGSA